MSDLSETQISQDFIDRLKSQDNRWSEVDMAIKVETELRDSVVIKAVLEVIENEAVEALEKMIFADPTDTKLMISLQATVRRARIMGNTLEAIRRKGAFSEQSLKDEGTIAADHLEENNGH